MKGVNSYHLLRYSFNIQISKTMMASQSSISFGSIGYILYMDDDSERKVDGWDDGWVLDSE